MSEELIQQLLSRLKALEQEFERTKVIEKATAVQGYVTTTDATVTTIATIAIPASTTIVI